MKQQLQNYSGEIPLRHLIANNIIQDIEKGLFKQNSKLVSINNYSKENGVSRDTVEKAYLRLRDLGYVKSVQGKGYYVTPKSAPKLKVMILLEDLDEQKSVVCRELMLNMSNYAQTEIRLYFHNAKILEEQIAQGKGSYHYYVLWTNNNPFSDRGIKGIVDQIPRYQLIVMEELICSKGKEEIVKSVLDRIALP